MSRTDRPRVSVIVPCHNAAPWLPEALESAAAQTLAPDEIIVIDDASADGSAGLARTWGEAVSIPVIVEQVVAHNAASARNVGARRARGDWLAFLDADDRWYPHHLERAWALLREGTDEAFLARCDFMSAEGDMLPGDEEAPRSRGSGLTAHDYVRLVARHGWCFAHCTVLYAKRRFMEAGGYDPSQVRRHDIDLWLRLIADSTWSYDDRVHATHRVETPGGISRKVTEACWYSFRATLRNAPRLPYPETQSLVRWQAFKAINSAWTDGTRAERRRVTREAWPHLAPKWRLALAPLRPWPFVYRLLNLVRRRVLGIRFRKEPA
jgi:glycosyltransferase involved in cell wall biosynthesis